MTALPGRVAGTVTPQPAPLPRVEAEALRTAVDTALNAAHNVERQLRRDIAAVGVTAVASRLNVSRSTVARLRDGGWPVAGALTRLRDTLRV